MVSLIENVRTNESITFRLDANELKALRKHAADKKISLNTLVNQILSDFVEWDMNAASAGYAVISKEVIKRVFDELDEETLERIAKKAAEYSKDILLLMKGKMDVEGGEFLIKNRAKRSGFVFKEFEEGKVRRLVLQHDMGRKYSVFYKAYHEEMIKKAGYSGRITITDNTLIMELEC